jgi:hypothetical protein
MVGKFNIKMQELIAFIPENKSGLAYKILFFDFVMVKRLLEDVKRRKA